MSEASKRLLEGDPRTLSRLITQLERGDSQVAKVLEEVHPHTGRAYCLGVTGPLGVGKSTLVDRLAELLRGEGDSVGIIAVDPTSPFSGGALLGDRIRMQRHYLDPAVFIRSMATRGAHGGLSRIIKGAVRLLDASGKDYILVETVGVGQTELDIMDVADTVMVVLVPEAGDAVQTLKAGLTEIADIFVVNKVDRPGAADLATALQGMLSLVRDTGAWVPPILTTQAHTGEGVQQLRDAVAQHRHWLEERSLLEQRRRQRRRGEFLETVQEALAARLQEAVQSAAGGGDLSTLLEQVEQGKVEPYSAALRLLQDQELLKQWVSSPFWRG
ncbi:MAG: methylmalonyl Co-A mutase-associated GTPase MeaB [Dehalococcoidia bacterium]